MRSLLRRRTRRELYSLVRHLHSASVFLFANVLIGTALYAIGNYQEFLDTTQHVMIALVRYLAIGAVLVTLVYFALAVVQMIVLRSFRLRDVLYAVLITAISSTLAIAGGILTTLSVY